LIDDANSNEGDKMKAEEANALVPEAADLRLAGYFPKTTAIPDGYKLPDNIREICTVSTCINAPEDWINKWLHNELGFYNSVSDARAILPSGSEGFVVFAYRILPVRFGEDSLERFDLPPLSIEPVDQSFISIGFDAISKSSSSFFECSPLSCNYMAQKIPVNRYCLVDTFAEGVSLAKRFAHEKVEPGPYYVFEVLRQHTQT
jgi:hypothetical protein